MLINTTLLIIGFVILIKGADFLVEGSSSIAKKLKVSSLIIGLTVVAFGTSAPELVVNVIASFQGASDLGVGNILGSNISNIFLVLGVSALIFPLKIQRSTVIMEIPFSLFTVILFWILANNFFASNGIPLILTRENGFVLILVFTVFLYYTFLASNPDNSNVPVFLKRILSFNHHNDDNNIKVFSTFKSIIFLVAGLAGLILGGKLIVDSSISIASFFGLSEFVIGVTVVALGTSLPELATSLVAAFKNEPDLAVGNIVGSNIFNILWVIGASALIAPITFNPVNNFDVGVNMLASLLLLIFMFVGKKQILSKREGTVFVLLYILYIGYQFV